MKKRLFGLILQILKENYMILKKIVYQKQFYNKCCHILVSDTSNKYFGNVEVDLNVCKINLLVIIKI